MDNILNFDWLKAQLEKNPDDKYPILTGTIIALLDSDRTDSEMVASIRNACAVAGVGKKNDK